MVSIMVTGCHENTSKKSWNYDTSDVLVTRAVQSPSLNENLRVRKPYGRKDERLDGYEVTMLGVRPHDQMEDFRTTEFVVGGVSLGVGEEGLYRFACFLTRVPEGTPIWLRYPGVQLTVGSLGPPYSPFTHGPRESEFRLIEARRHLRVFHYFLSD